MGRLSFRDDHLACVRFIRFGQFFQPLKPGDIIAKRGKVILRRFSLLMICLCALSVVAFAQVSNPPSEASPLQVGYVIVTPHPDNIGGLVVFETFGRTSGKPTSQATVLPGRISTKASFFASSDITFANNVGFAIANPGGANASVTVTLRRFDGAAVSERVITVGAHQQVAQFISELFSDVAAVLQNFNGTIGVVSDYPVAIMGLRFSEGNFSTIPVTTLFPLIELPIPDLAPGVGGPGAVILPQFVADGGWSSEIVAINTTALPMIVRVDVFKQDGTPLITKLNEQSASSFLNLSIAPGGVITLSP